MSCRHEVEEMILKLCLIYFNFLFKWIYLYLLKIKMLVDIQNYGK